MVGVLEELLRLESAKREALIGLNSEVYENSVRQQISLLDNPGLSAAAQAAPDKLHAFSKIARTNTRLYENLMATVPWVASGRYYTGQGYITEPPVTRGFSAEA